MTRFSRLLLISGLWLWFMADACTCAAAHYEGALTIFCAAAECLVYGFRLLALMFMNGELK